MTISESILKPVIEALRPVPDREVWEWAAESVNLTVNVTRFPGRWRADRSPYVTGEWGPLWAFRRYRVIDCIWAAQTGKTLMMQLTIGYSVANDPGPGMVVYPDQNTGKRRSRKHLQPFVKDCLPEFCTGISDDLQTFEYHLINCDIVIGWAGSASIMASEPIRYLWQDEKAKYQRKTAEEADAVRLSMRRTISYGDFARVFGCTTPTVASAPGWNSWKDSTQCQRHVPCPYCGHFQVMYFGLEDRRWFEDVNDESKLWEGGIRWDRSEDISKLERIESAYYQCESCHAHWSNADKNKAVANGKWVARNPDAKNYACHLPSWYAKWVKLSDIVERWFEAYRDDEARHDFLNSDCAVPYEVRSKSVEESALKKHVLPGHHQGIVPNEAVHIYLTADVHDDHIRYRVRAWAPDMTSWGVEEGQLPAELSSLDGILAREYRRGGEPAYIHAGLIDCGWRTDEVYQWCLCHDGLVWPVMGGAPREAVKYENQHVMADPEKGLLRSGTIQRVFVNDHRWKDTLYSRLQVSLHAPGAWYLEQEVSDEFIYQMRGEQKVKVPNTKSLDRFEWRQVHENHAWDCEKYQLICTQVFQLSSMIAINEQVRKSSEVVYNPYTNKPINT